MKFNLGRNTEARFRSLSSGNILKLKFDQYFAADAWWRLLSSILIKIMKLGLVKMLKFKCNQNVWLRFWSWFLVEIMKMKFDQDL